MARILKGSEVNIKLNEFIKREADLLKEKGVKPTLGIIRIGQREDDISYEKGVKKRCDSLGITIKQYIFSEKDVKEEDLIQTIKEVNKDESIHGVLMFRPLPKHLNEKKICQMLNPRKDVDGITNSSLVGTFTGEEIGFLPCTAQACMEILDYYDIDLTSKKAVVIGRSLVVGKPAAMLLLERNATVTICHSKTKNMEDIVKEADIIIAAAGSAQMINRSYLKKGQVIIDVGIHVTEEGRLVGDVNYEEAYPIAEAITPVPGGVGTVTTSVLISHVVKAAKQFNFEK